MKHLQPTLLCLLLALPGCATAYTPAASPRVTLTPAGIYKDGQRVGTLTYGAPDAVKGNPYAESEADLGKTLSIAGWVFQVGALGTIGASAAVAAQDNNESKQGLVLGLLVGALAASFIGDGLWIAGNTHSLNAINIYNDGLTSAPSASGSSAARTVR